MADFARQVLLTMPELENGIAIGGSSFGGFVAWELAALVRPTKLILLGSASSRTAVRAFLRALLPVARGLPPPVFAALSYCGISGAPLFGARDLAAARTFSAMARRASPSFLAWAMDAISHWEPSPLSSSTAVYRLHGGRDLLIRPPVQQCHLIKKAGHLPTLTDPDEVCAFLIAALQ